MHQRASTELLTRSCALILSNEPQLTPPSVPTLPIGLRARRSNSAETDTRDEQGADTTYLSIELQPTTPYAPLQQSEDWVHQGTLCRDLTTSDRSETRLSQEHQRDGRGRPTILDEASASNIDSHVR